VDWVGRYVGAATGTVAGEAVDNRPVELLIRFDQPAGPQCPGCVTVTFMDYFAGSNLFPQSSITADWTVTIQGYRRTLMLMKFSSGSVPGTTLLGSVVVEAPDSAGAVRSQVDVEFVVDRR